MSSELSDRGKWLPRKPRHIEKDNGRCLKMERRLSSLLRKSWHDIPFPAEDAPSRNQCSNSDQVLPMDGLINFSLA